MESWRKRDTDTVTDTQADTEAGRVDRGEGWDSPTRIRMTVRDKESRWIDREERKGIVEVRLTEPTCASVSLYLWP